MDGRTFEQYLATLFRRLGYEVTLTRHRGDYGADLVVRKDGRRNAVQAKRWNKTVGVKAVQEAVAAKGLYECDLALVVTNSHFTQQARRLARANEVELWDRRELVQRLHAVKGEPELVDQPELDPVSLVVIVVAARGLRRDSTGSTSNRCSSSYLLSYLLSQLLTFLPARSILPLWPRSLFALRGMRLPSSPA